jgi:hypothetical protein
MDNAVALEIGGKPFVCVRLSEADFSDLAAVYVVLCGDPKGSWKVLDVGQSGQVGSRIDDHDRRACWVKSCASSNIWVCVYRMPSDRYTKQDRERLEEELRAKYRPPCGKR